MESREASSQTFEISRYSVDAPPGKIENRVFIGGNYALMPILREIASVVLESNLQPIIAYDFDIPFEKTRELTLRLLFQCKIAIFDETLGNGQLVEIVRASGFSETCIFQVYMAIDERREPPKTMSVMVWQATPPPQGYLTINELREIVGTFLARNTRKLQESTNHP
ncbi:MAG: hypothetical protein ABSD73_04215 [Candidatus Bathyarchaeia archaeon]